MGERSTIDEAFEHLRNVGFRPATVIDVGIAEGTPGLYESFPDARFLLVEPLEEFRHVIEEIERDYDADHVFAAAAAEAGTATLHVAQDDLRTSTLLEDIGTHDWGERQVPLVRLDDVVAEKGLRGPFLIKADTQGSELDVLRGAERTLAETEVAVLEVSFFPFYEGGAQFKDVLDYMHERGFVVYDLVGRHQRPYDDALAQTDVVFAREDGELRRSNRYD